MILFFCCGLTHLRHFIFSEGDCRMLDWVVIVNGGRKIIRPRLLRCAAIFGVRFRGAGVSLSLLFD
jgi:hypothetical protein